MPQEKPAIRLKIGIVKVFKRIDVPNKPYQKLDFTATTEKTAATEYQFITFSSSVMDIVEASVGKAIDVEVVTEERKVLSVYDNGKVRSAKDISIEAQVAIYASTNLRVAGIKVPKEICDMADDWMKKALAEGLK